MKKKGKFLLSIILCFLLIAGTCQAGAIDHMVVSQFLQQGNKVTLYVNLFDQDYMSVSENYEVSDFTVSLNGGTHFTPATVQNVSQSSEGTTYLLAFDVSRSVTNTEVQHMRKEVGEMINSLRPQDTMRLMGIGESVTVLRDFTSDKALLTSALEKINNKEGGTYLYQGLSAAMDALTARNVQAGRSVIIVFTDGMDDSDNGFGENEVIKQLRNCKVPIYVVGLTGTLKNADLSSVGEIARASGGSLYSEKKYKIAGCMDNIMNVVNSAVSLSFELPYEYFTIQNMTWEVRCLKNTYVISSPVYVHTLKTEGVATPTPEPTATPSPTPTPTPTPRITLPPTDVPTTALPVTPSPTPTLKPDDTPEPIVEAIVTATPTVPPTPTPALYGTMIGDLVIANVRLGDVLMNPITWAVSGALLLIVIVLIVLLILKGKKKNQTQNNTITEDSKHGYKEGKIITDGPIFEPFKSDSENSEKTIDIYGDGEVTLNPYSESSGEETLNPYGDSEVTLNPYGDMSAPPVTVIRFRVNTKEETPYEEEVTFADSMEIGRDVSCQLCISPRYVSRHHLEITEMADGVHVRNLTYGKPDNYTRLNRSLLGKDSMPLSVGDRLEIAQTCIDILLIEKQ